MIIVKGTPPTRDFDTDTDSGMAAMGLPKANHGPAWLKSAQHTPKMQLKAKFECTWVPWGPPEGHFRGLQTALSGLGDGPESPYIGGWACSFRTWGPSSTHEQWPEPPNR